MEHREIALQDRFATPTFQGARAEKPQRKITKDAGTNWGKLDIA